jgi:hypothetical protein
MLRTADTGMPQLHLVFCLRTVIDWNNTSGGLKMPVTSELHPK